MKRNQGQRANQTPPLALSEPTESEIQKEAYYIWIERGRPAGCDVEIWHTATELLRHRHENAHPAALSAVFVPLNPKVRRAAAMPARP